MSFKWKSQCGEVSPQLLHSQFLFHLFIYSTGAKYRSAHSQMRQLGWAPSTKSDTIYTLRHSDSSSVQGTATWITCLTLHTMHIQNPHTKWLLGRLFPWQQPDVVHIRASTLSRIREWRHLLAFPPTSQIKIARGETYAAEVSTSRLQIQLRKVDY